MNNLARRCSHLFPYERFMLKSYDQIKTITIYFGTHTINTILTVLHTENRIALYIFPAFRVQQWPGHGQFGCLFFKKKKIYFNIIMIFGRRFFLHSTTV